MTHNQTQAVRAMLLSTMLLSSTACTREPQDLASTASPVAVASASALVDEKTPPEVADSLGCDAEVWATVAIGAQARREGGLALIRDLSTCPDCMVEVSRTLRSGTLEARMVFVTHPIEDEYADEQADIGGAGQSQQYNQDFRDCFLEVAHGTSYDVRLVGFESFEGTENFANATVNVRNELHDGVAYLIGVQTRAWNDDGIEGGADNWFVFAETPTGFTRIAATASTWDDNRDNATFVDALPQPHALAAAMHNPTWLRNGTAD